VNEADAIRQMNEQLDRLLARDEPGKDGAPQPGWQAVASRLAALPELLPAPDAAFERRVWRQIEAVERTGQARRSAWPGRGRRRLLWLAPAAALLLLLVLVLPGPRAAVGNWMARFRLGQVDVVVAPEATERPALAAQPRTFADLAAAQQATDFPLLAPGQLPAGFYLDGVTSVAYDQLPAWLQPLYVEASYRPLDAPPGPVYMLLRQYNAHVAGNVSLDQIEFQSADVRSTREIVLGDGAVAVLLEFRTGDPVLRKLIWQYDGMTFDLSSQVLSSEELVRIAQSLGNVQQ
jgi:hypothetical protein